MHNQQDNITQATPPKEFVEQVKQALEHLYDFAYLQKHSLAQDMVVTKKRERQTTGHHLRGELMRAIEALSPGPSASLNTPDARLYSLLQLHYVKGLTIQDVGYRLGLSTRQVHRSLRRAEEGVATILWAKLSDANQQSAQKLSSVKMEMAQLETSLDPINVSLLVQEAQQAVASLAFTRGVTFDILLPDEPVVISADTAVSRQLFVSIFSRIIQLAQPKSIQIIIAQTSKQATLTFVYSPESITPTEPILNQVLASLTNRMRWRVQESKTTKGTHHLSIQMMMYGPVILVIDDNEGLVELLERYLTGHQCRVIAATNGREAHQLVQQITPDAVILDVMMPEISGWELLQILRSRSETAETPVIICSVFNDPDLAYSLGASHFLSKPISRDNILDALRSLAIVP